MLKYRILSILMWTKQDHEITMKTRNVRFSPGLFPIEINYFAKERIEEPDTWFTKLKLQIQISYEALLKQLSGTFRLY